MSCKRIFAVVLAVANIVVITADGPLDDENSVSTQAPINLDCVLNMLNCGKPGRFNTKPSSAGTVRIEPRELHAVTIKPSESSTLTSTLRDTSIETTGMDMDNPTDDVNNQNNSTMNCECHPFYLCNADLTLKTDGAYVQDLRVERRLCPKNTDQCCFRNDVRDTPIPTPKPLFFDPSRCGVRNKNGVSGFRIKGAGKNEVQFGEFPWVVSILKADWRGRMVYSGVGSLIRPNVVLTAAHLVHDVRSESDLMVTAGEWDTQHNDEPLPSAQLFVSKVIVHEHFTTSTSEKRNDIALLILTSSFTLAENIGLVCLPEQDAEFDSQTCFANGWGKDDYGAKGRNQTVLKKVELPVVPRSACLSKLRRVYDHNVNFHSSFLCAGGVAGEDTCKGDGGGPLTCLSRDNVSYVQAGITSAGFGCNRPIPGLYTKVSNFIKWIDEKLLTETSTTSFQKDLKYK